MVTLTERQEQVLRLAGDGLTYREIGDELAIKPETAKHHAKVICKKLGATSKRELVVLARAYFNGTQDRGREPGAAASDRESVGPEPVAASAGPLSRSQPSRPRTGED